jgi:hypothetical protein
VERKYFDSIPLTSLALSPDGTKVALGFGGGDDDLNNKDKLAGTVNIWDVASGKLLGRFLGHTAGRIAGEGTCLLFTPDGGGFVTLHQDRSIRVWEIATGKEICSLPSQPEAVRALNWCDRGRFLASAGSKKVVTLWDLTFGKEAGRLEGHEATVIGLAANPDGKTLFSSSDDHTILAWDLAKVLPKDAVQQPLNEKELGPLWDQLGDFDPAKAYQAVWTFVGSPKPSLPYLHGMLAKTAAKVDPKRVAKLIKDLDDNEPSVRETASRDLELLGANAETALRKALDDPPSLEVKKRVETLLGKLNPSILSESQSRTQRAIAVLEHLATEEARTVLKKLADGPDSAVVTRDSKAALRRLTASPER